MRFSLIAGGFGVCALGVLCRKTEERVGRGISGYRVQSKRFRLRLPGRKDLGAYSFSGGRLWGTRELIYSFAMTLLCIFVQTTPWKGPTQGVEGDWPPLRKLSSLMKKHRRRSLAAFRAVPKMENRAVEAQLANVLTASVRAVAVKELDNG